MVETAVGAQHLAAFLRGLDQLLLVEIGEDRQMRHDLADPGDLGVGHGAIHGRHGDHDIDEREVMVQRLGHGASPSLCFGQQPRRAGP